MTRRDNGMNDLSPAAVKAAYRQGHRDAWGSHGSASDHARYCEPLRSRRKCWCGCGGRQTHIGMANGVGLYCGCELSVWRWVKTGSPRARSAGIKVVEVGE